MVVLMVFNGGLYSGDHDKRIPHSNHHEKHQDHQNFYNPQGPSISSGQIHLRKSQKRSPEFVIVNLWFRKYESFDVGETMSFAPSLSHHHLFFGGIVETIPGLLVNDGIVGKAHWCFFSTMMVSMLYIHEV